MSPAFGFSVGDFVAVATMIWKISQALSSVSEDSKLYHELQLELSAFQGAFVQLQQAVVNGATPPPDQVTRTKEVLAQIQRLTNDFNNHMEKFKDISTSAQKDGAKKYVILRKRVSWTLYGKRPILQFREAIRGYTAVLVLIMHALNSQAMQGLHQEIQTGAKQLKLHMKNTFEEPWDQKPIRFQDAIGRRYPVPLEICGTFEGFLDFLQHAFKNNPISDAVQKQSIWLFSPVVAETKTWVLITAEDWRSSLYPGMQLGMSVFDGSRGLISDALSDTISETVVRLQTPLPLWASATFPEDAKFKLRAPRQRKSLMTKGSCHIHDKCLEPRHMKENTSARAPLVSYPCPNVARCEKRFKSQEELFEHLKPKMFELESLRSFLGLGQRLGDCLFCSGGSTWSTQAIFEKGIELQKSLTSTGSGLAPCVAEMVAAGDLDVQRVCDCTSCWNRYYGEYGHFPITQTTPLHAAATNGLIHVVEMILQNGGDINLQCSESGTPLHAAARAGQKSIVKLLLDRDAILKSQDYDTALCAAAARGHEEIVRMLLDHGANANAEGEVHFSQCTALQAASEAGHFEVVQVLLDKGANVKAQCGDQGTALHKALACGHLEVARLLLDKCANVDSLDGRRRTPLQIASKRGRLELVRLLLDNGANVNAQGGDYGTALQAAIDSGKRELVQLLLDRGALPLGGDGETERNRDC